MTQVACKFALFQVGACVAWVPMRIGSEQEFLRLVEEVDEELKREGIGIAARPIQAWIRVAQRLGGNLPFDGEAIPGLYEGESLSGHIDEWYNRRYGTKLNVDFSPGCLLVFIRGDLYLAKIPLLIGTAAVFIERAETPKTPGEVLRKGPFNLLDFVQDLGSGLRAELTDDELNGISQECYEGLCQTARWRAAGRPFVEEVLTDLRLSAMLGVEGKFGFSRWHSLQAAEKALKFFIRERRQEPKHIHCLHTLHRDAIALGLVPLPGSWLDAAQCKAEVRYKIGSTSANSHQANIGARWICTEVAVQLRPTSPR